MTLYDACFGATGQAINEMPQTLAAPNAVQYGVIVDFVLSPEMAMPEYTRLEPDVSFSELAKLLYSAPEAR